MDNVFINFSYGSNMSSKRFGNRIDYERMCIGVLENHQLKFHKLSIDGSGKCDVFNTGDENDKVWGVLYKISKVDEKKLDGYEGYPSGYAKKEVNIKKIDGEIISAKTYYATKINESLKPYDWYKYHVLYGAIENNLPKDYIHQIESINSEIDPKESRALEQFSIYHL